MGYTTALHLATIFDTRIEYLRGVGPQKAELLNKELGIFTYGDLLQHYPFRYEDRSTFLKINALHEELEHVQVIARIKKVELLGMGAKKRLVAHVEDETGEMEMTWFKGISWIQKKLPLGACSALTNTIYSSNLYRIRYVGKILGIGIR